VIAPWTVCLRPTRRLALAVGVAAVGLIAILAASGGEPDVAPVAESTPTEPSNPQCTAAVPAWTMEAAPVERIGYRDGRRHTFEVVALGPTAVEVEVDTARAFLAMREAAAKECVELRLESGFRTAAEQRELFRAWRKGRGNKAARPGRSNHQSGRALDISVISVPGARDWLETNAVLFGFTRTVRNEPWHWEYLDSPIARGPAKRVVRKAKAAVAVKRPAKRPTSAGKTARSSGGRVASSRAAK
jgi:hypothetical protein